MSKAIIYYVILVLLALSAIAFVIYGNLHYTKHFSEDIMNELSIGDSTFPAEALGGYQSEYAVISDGEEIGAEMFDEDCHAALMVDNESHEFIVAHNVLRRIYPASTTKLMTGILVCDALNSGKLSLDDEVTLEKSSYVSDPAAVASPLGYGCTITVRNLLYGLMMASYNDYAVILAELVGGSESQFVEMMNQKAYNIGATGSHFANPHGLHDDDHYITAYDMYLIINEAAKYEVLQEIDSYKTFSYTYKNADGSESSDDITPTNEMLSGNYSLPSNIEIHEWKTGTTSLGGNILTMNVSINGKSYSMYVADEISHADLYEKIGTMFNLAK